MNMMTRCLHAVLAMGMIVCCGLAQVKAQKENLQAETDRYHRYAEKMEEELAKFEVRR